MLAPHAERIAASYACGPGAELRGPVARGEQGEVWRLDASAGSWAVKLLFEQPDRAAVRADGDYQEAVRAAGVPVPRLRRTPEGEILSRVEDGWVRVYEWIDLRDPDPALEPGAVGALVAAIHGVRSSSALRPVDPWYSEPVGAVRWDELVAGLGERGAPFAGHMAELRDELVALERLLAPPRRLQVCHRDLWADNLRATERGGLCVIDWENGGLADPSQELALVLFEFGLGDAGRMRALFDAYAEAGGPGRIEGPGDCSMLIAQLGHVLELACRRWLAPGACEADLERAAERVDEFAGRPLTRAVIEELVAAVLC